MEVIEVAQQVKALAANPSDPCLILGTHIVEGKEPSPASTQTHKHPLPAPLLTVSLKYFRKNCM